MEYFKRRSFLKSLGTIPFVYTFGKSSSALATPEISSSSSKSAIEITTGSTFRSGYLSIIQGPTSDCESLINVFTPRLKKYTYEIIDNLGNKYFVVPYSTVKGPGFYNIDKIKAINLSLNLTYTLKVLDGKTTIDERQFKALDIYKKIPHFALISCMADDFRFDAVIDPMWERVRNENPDFLILSGDIVYVDSFEFVERTKATEFDLWQRYVDSLRRIPMYHWSQLIPTFTTWDDHDYGTNDGDREFISKDVAANLFRAAFGGDELPGVWSQGPYGVSNVLSAFGQNFYFMDDRTFRQPNKNQNTEELYGQWGQSQHEWLVESLKEKTGPSWIINGNQCFNGKELSFKECFEGNDPQEFELFIDQLKTLKTPVVFASGDIHFSEVMAIPAHRLGYETFEFTSSALHSYIDGGWENPLRVEGAYCEEFNFFMIQSQVLNESLQIAVSCLGLDPIPYFKKNFKVTPNHK